MAALRDSLNTSAACTLPAVSLHRRYTWDAYHVGLAGQRAAGTQGAAGFSPRGPSDGATAGIHNAGGIGGLLAVEAPQAVGDPLRHWYFYDGNGNVGQLLAYDATGPAVNATPGAKYEYDPYGQLVNWTDTIANPFRFSTKWFDTTTGLSDWGYRYYSPSLGRWMSRDPIEERGGRNLSQYTHNDPIHAVDMLGLYYVIIRERLIRSHVSVTTYQASGSVRCSCGSKSNMTLTVTFGLRWTWHLVYSVSSSVACDLGASPSGCGVVVRTLKADIYADKWEWVDPTTYRTRTEIYLRDYSHELYQFDLLDTSHLCCAR